VRRLVVPAAAGDPDLLRAVGAHDVDLRVRRALVEAGLPVAIAIADERDPASIRGPIPGGRVVSEQPRGAAARAHHVEGGSGRERVRLERHTREDDGAAVGGPGRLHVVRALGHAPLRGSVGVHHPDLGPRRVLRIAADRTRERDPATVRRPGRRMVGSGARHGAGRGPGAVSDEDVGDGPVRVLLPAPHEGDPLRIGGPPRLADADRGAPQPRQAPPPGPVAPDEVEVRAPGGAERIQDLARRGTGLSLLARPTRAGRAGDQRGRGDPRRYRARQEKVARSHRGPGALPGSSKAI
jgi:hypothetical protein